MATNRRKRKKAAPESPHLHDPAAGAAAAAAAAASPTTHAAGGGKGAHKRGDLASMPDAAPSASSWTTDHALIGQVALQGKVLAPILADPAQSPGGPRSNSASAAASAPEDLLHKQCSNHAGSLPPSEPLPPQQYGCVWDAQVVHIASFHPEDIRQRQPALWRGLLRPPSGGGSDGQAGLSPHGVGLLLPRAVDAVSSDLAQRAFELLPPPANLSVTGERVFRVLYHRVVSEHLPVLLLAAVCEEIQSQFLKQYTQSQQQQSKSTRSAASPSSGWSHRPPEYYSKPPSAYLTAPVLPPSSASQPDGGAAASLPSFNASQLASRIKHGCHLAWKHYTDFHYRPPPPPLPSSASSSAPQPLTDGAPAWDQRRSSTRLAKQQRHHPSSEESGAADQSQASSERHHPSDGEPSPYWKVIPGGKVALQLHRTLLAAPPSQKGLPNTQAELVAPETAGIQQPTQPPNTEARDDLPASTSTNAETPPEAEAAMAVPSSPAKSASPDVKAKPAAAPSTAVDAPPPASGDVEADPPQAEEREENDGAGGGNAPDVPAVADSPQETAENGEATAAEPEVPSVDEEMAAAEEDDQLRSAATSPEKHSDRDDDEDFVPAADDDEEEEGDDAEGPRYVQENVQQLVQEAAALQKAPSERSAESPSAEAKGGDDHSDKEDQEADEAEVDEDADLILKNPYLAATAPATLDFLGRKTAKLLTVSDLQEIIPTLLCKSKKKKAKRPTGIPLAAFGTDVDRLIWQKIDPSLSLKPDSRVALQLTAEYEDENVERWETSYFARAPLAVSFLDRSSRVQPDDALAEELFAQYKERKAWDSWRYKSIHGGYTVWPSWLEAVRRRRGSPDSDQPRPAAHSIRDSSNVSTTITAPEAATETSKAVSSDFAVAQALAQEEAATIGEVTTRRTTRRGGDSSGVFYGNQSNMTQRQLMDTLLRLISEKGFQTAASLVASVPDESSDPLRRIRGALGKLLWRRNQISQIFVQNEWTDDLAQNHLRTSPLQAIAEADGGLNDDEASALTTYMRYLHDTELRLRALILKHLTNVPIVILATAADERPGSLDSMDSSYFADAASIQWKVSGHSLLGRIIYRPSVTVNADEHASCRWYRVAAFCESVASAPAEEDSNPMDRPNIGNAKEATTVQRRMRFKAAPVRSPSDTLPTSNGNNESIVLTQAQVHAGAKAAELEQSLQAMRSRERDRNPFADGSNPQVTLFPANASAVEQQIHGLVAGHDASVDETGKLCHRVLVVPQPDTPSNAGSAVWVRMDVAQDGALQCTIDGRATPYNIQQFDYHSSSPAFRECLLIVNYLQRHPKAGPFLQPVDPIALKIPQYRDIVKNPMDISTLAQKLERGQYSNIGPGQTTGLTPIARMLNGPFRKDVELIFDNAMLFNPPDDWIYMAAAAIKKAVVKKIEQAALAADQKSHGRAAASRSIYVDEDSDVDMYVYESDQDDDYTGAARRKRKRPAAPTVLKEDTAMRVIERPHRLQKILSESTGLRGPLSDLPVNGSAGSFSLPSEWTCRRRAVPVAFSSTAPVHRDAELEELLLLQQQLEETESTGQRRSTRSHDHGEAGGAAGSSESVATSSSLIEFVPQGPWATAVPNLPTSRTELELECERLHEEYFAKLWKAHHKRLVSKVPEETGLGSNVGSFADGTFPPYLGRVVPASGSAGCVWEIREPFALVAVRWVMRGLIRSGHLTETEPLTADSLQSGAVLVNNVYTLSEGEPFEELDVKELTRRKRADQEAPPSEDEVELSEYEKQRLERVARNAERLKALGLA